MGRQVLGFTLGAFAALCTLGCSPGTAPEADDDPSCSQAKPLPGNILVKDSLDIAGGDAADCKKIKYFKVATAKVEYVLGTAFEPHNVKGVLTIFNQDGQVIDRKTVDPTVFRYNFEFAIEPNQPNFIEFKGTEGKHAYTAQVRYEQADPCAKCTDSQDCKDGECVDKVKVCDPECEEDDGFICEEGACVYQCSSACKRKNQRRWSCDVETGDCERVRKTCKPRCKRGMRCNRRNGQCYTPKPRSNTCEAGCKPGQICKKGKCVQLGGNPCAGCTGTCNASTGYKCEPSAGVNPTGPIRGRITSTVRNGSGTIVYINRGNKHKIKAGKNGKLCGKFRIQITNVYATRSKARTKASIEEIGGCKTVSVAR
ncbi:MAG: hypothetical protein ACI9OJ_003851 [Myxococcota bacterium]|jgi:hypothetical protein